MRVMRVMRVRDSLEHDGESSPTGQLHAKVIHQRVLCPNHHVVWMITPIKRNHRQRIWSYADTVRIVDLNILTLSRLAPDVEVELLGRDEETRHAACIGRSGDSLDRLGSCDQSRSPWRAFVESGLTLHVVFCSCFIVEDVRDV